METNLTNEGYLSCLLSQTASYLYLSQKIISKVKTHLTIPYNSLKSKKIYVPFSIQKLHIKSAYISLLIGPLIKFTFGHPYF